MVTGGVGALGGLAPSTFLAVTEKRYAWPFWSPVTTPDVAWPPNAAVAAGDAPENAVTE